MIRKISLLLWTLPLLAALLLLLWPDEKLHPTAAAWLAPASVPIADEENLFFALLGITAPLGQDPHTSGERQLQDLLQQWQQAEAEGDDPQQRAEQVMERRTPLGISGVCNWAQESCWQLIDLQPEPFFATLADHQPWLQRYRNLHHYRHFHDPLPPLLITLPPHYGELVQLQQLLHLELALRFASGDAVEVLAILEAEFQFSRMLLAQSNTLVAKVVALRLFSNGLHLLSALLDLPEPSPLLYHTITNLPPLNRAERSLEAALRSEFRGHAEQLLHLGSEASTTLPLPAWLTQAILPYKPHAIINRSWPSYADLTQLAQLDYASGKALRGAPHPYQQPAWWEWIYNYSGIVIAQIATPDLARYALLPHEVNGLLTLLHLKAELRSSEQQPSDLHHPRLPHSSHPYTGQPVEWHPETRHLRYTPADYSTHDHYTMLRMGSWFADRPSGQ